MFQYQYTLDFHDMQIKNGWCAAQAAHTYMFYTSL